jgi:hypothetical protein
MTQEKATMRPCSHNHTTNFNWETKAAYDNGQMLCWDCNQMFTPEPLPQSYASLVNERDALLSEVAQLREALVGGVGVIASERARHLAVEGWTPEHDDEHSKGELAQAAACYAWPPMRPIEVKKAWPWRGDEWKPELFGVGAGEFEKTEARIRVLAKAGALVAAEIDRLERARAALAGKER